MSATTMRLTRLVAHPVSCFLLVLSLISCTACTAKRVPVHIEFSAAWGGQPIQCESNAAALTDLRFFVSSIFLIDPEGNEHNVVLASDDRWQQRNIALIDLENSAGTCSNGTPQMNMSIAGTVAASDIVAAKFTIGVPFDTNHANPLLARAPLDRAAMHWHWRSGYKFLRAGISNPTDSFWIHLGSTGCEGTIRHISRCNSPNRVTVEIANFTPDTDRIMIELAELFRDVDLEDGIRTDCSSSPAESACAAPFEALGLDFGGRTNDQTQRVFQVQR